MTYPIDDTPKEVMDFLGDAAGCQENPKEAANRIAELEAERLIELANYLAECAHSYSSEELIRYTSSGFGVSIQRQGFMYDRMMNFRRIWDGLKRGEIPQIKDTQTDVLRQNDGE